MRKLAIYSLIYSKLTLTWEILRSSFKIVVKNKKLVVFPLLAFTVSVIFLGTIFGISILTDLISLDSNFEYSPSLLIPIFIAYFGVWFIFIFFDVAAVFIIKHIFEDQKTPLKEGFKYAFTKIGWIFGWSLISGTIGLLIRSLESIVSSGANSDNIFVAFIFSIFLWLIKLAWNLMTYFVIQSMIYYDLSPMEAISKSKEVFKEMWGETFISQFSLNTIFGILVGIPVYLSNFLFSFIINSGGENAIIYYYILFGLIMIYSLLLRLFFNIIEKVFKTALFLFATTGSIPEVYNIGLFQNSFKTKKETTSEPRETEIHT
jgi:hypothetical protein